VTRVRMNPTTMLIANAGGAGRRPRPPGPAWAGWTPRAAGTAGPWNAGGGGDDGRCGRGGCGACRCVRPLRSGAGGWPTGGPRVCGSGCDPVKNESRSSGGAGAQPRKSSPSVRWLTCSCSHVAAGRAGRRHAKRPAQERVSATEVSG
jgi:hypothetical protein